MNPATTIFIEGQGLSPTWGCEVGINPTTTITLFVGSGLVPDQGMNRDKPVHYTREILSTKYEIQNKCQTQNLNDQKHEGCEVGINPTTTVLFLSLRAERGNFSAKRRRGDFLAAPSLLA